MVRLSYRLPASYWWIGRWGRIMPCQAESYPRTVHRLVSAAVTSRRCKTLLSPR